MKKMFGFAVIAMIILSLSLGAFAQGKGGGKGNSGGKGGGNGGSRGPTSAGDSDRDQGKNKNKGKNNDVLGSEKHKDKNKNKDKDKDKNDDKENNRYKGLSKKTGISEDVLRARFEAEKALNPKLNHGQFVAAHMIAKNHDGISTGDILGGLRSGRSIGQILHDRGWDKDRIKKERKRIKKEMKKNRDRNDRDDDDDFDDDDRDWNF